MSKSRRITSVIAAGLGAIALVTGTVAPAQAGPNTPNRGRYAAVGDSFAAGVGLPVLKNVGQSLRSAGAYPVLLAGKDNKVTFLAASGATTADVLAGQIAGIPDTARQVTVTVGGNDVGFAHVAGTCLTAPQACKATLNAAAAKIPAAGAGVVATVAAIKQRAPGAEVYVTGYPQLFQPFSGPGCASLPLFALVGFDAATMGLNGTIHQAAMASGATFVDVTDDFAGHGLCSADSWIQGPGGVAPLHPTADGQQAYADALAGAGVRTSKD